MGDMGDGFRELREIRRERREESWDRNMNALHGSGRKFEVRGTSVLFREPGMPAVDFWPSTGRWRSGGKTYNGGAESLLGWYLKKGAQA